MKLGTGMEGMGELLLRRMKGQKEWEGLRWGVVRLIGQLPTIVLIDHLSPDRFRWMEESRNVRVFVDGSLSLGVMI